MTNPAEYISGRTVQEQMNELISYVDTRAASVALDAIASDMASLAQAVQDAQDAQAAAEQARDTAISTVSDCVKKTPGAAQTITGQDLIVSGADVQAVDLRATNDLTVTGTGTIGTLAASTGTVSSLTADTATEATGTYSTKVANSTKVKNELDNYSQMLRTTGNQTYAGTKTTSELQVAPVRPYLFQRVDATTNWYPVFSCSSGARKIIVLDVYGAHQSHNTEDYAKLVIMTGRGVVKLVNDITGSLDAARFAWCYNSSTSRYELWVSGTATMYTYVEIVRAIRGNIEEPLSELANIYDASQATAALDTNILTSITYGTS